MWKHLVVFCLAGLATGGGVALDAARAQPVRDLWQQRDLGTFSNRFTARVPAHGAVLVKVGAPGRRVR